MGDMMDKTIPIYHRRESQWETKIFQPILLKDTRHGPDRNSNKKPTICAQSNLDTVVIPLLRIGERGCLTIAWNEGKQEIYGEQRVLSR